MDLSIAISYSLAHICFLGKSVDGKIQDFGFEGRTPHISISHF
jgi:hypothetical protein